MKRKEPGPAAGAACVGSERGPGDLSSSGLYGAGLWIALDCPHHFCDAENHNV